MVTLVAVLGFLLTVVSLMAISTLVRAALTRGGPVPGLNGGQHQHEHNITVLWGLILLAIAYVGLLRYMHTLTGMAILDGGIGVAVGLYICAHPAANAVDVLFFGRQTLSRLSEWSVVRWLALNLLVLLAGWVVIFVGLRRFLL